MSLTEEQPLLAVPFSAIPPAEVEPLWPGWINRRHVTLLVAPGGTGKGLLTVDMAARVTTGRPFPGEPDDVVHEPANVIIVASEDDPNEAVAWRLVAAGADSRRVFNLTVLPGGEHFSLPQSVGVLREAVEQIGNVALIIIDPLMATLGKGARITTNDGARAVITPLQDLARDTGAAVVLTHHTVKSGKTAGSKGLTDAVRIVIRIDRPDMKKAARVLSVEKSNNGDDSGTLRYEVTGTDAHDAHLTWPADHKDPAEGRGYTVAPDWQQQVTVPKPSVPKPSVPSVSRQAKPSVKPVVSVPEQERFEVYATRPATGAVLLGSFATRGEAHAAAQAESGYALPWKAGMFVGSESAAAKEGESGYVHYSLIPVDVNGTPAPELAKAAA